jgi:crotonobetaine/carnitine-CoA ligase
MPADEQAGEDEVCVFVVARDGMEVTAEEISKWAAERLPSFCRPRYVRIMEELPVTPSGKVRKAELRSLDIGLAWDRAAHGDGV